jgi:uncharacterized protein
VALKTKLRSLYLLQLLDTELDELRELRGDLPETVHQLEATVNDLRARIEECDTALKVGAAERTRKEKESLEFLSRIERYKSQQLEVTNNKEYDALTREIETAESTIVTYEAEIEQFADEAQQLRARMEDLEVQLNSLQGDLDEKIEELQEVMKVTAEEERELESHREEALGNIGSSDLELYTRIRNAKGRAVAPVRRGSCSGCYNVVPPQRILEIKKHERLFICEHCGRILVSEEIALEAKKK